MSDVGGFKIQIDQAAIGKFAEGEELTQMLTIAALAVEGEAKRLVPVDTGNLRRSITHELGKRGHTQYARVGTNVKYGLFQELGTVNHPPQPYLRPALYVLKELFG